jgi:energy-coupling factor transport system substrate-specific component
MKPWKLREAILVAIVSVIFALLYLANGLASVLMTTLLTPIGLGPLGSEPVYGVWFMAATFIGYFVRKPGAALVTEILASLLEVVMGSMFGPLVLVSGTAQGLGAELVFMSTGYKNYSLRVMALAGMASAVTSFIADFFIHGYTLLSFGFLSAILLIRLLSSAFFCGYVTLLLTVNLEKTGLTKAYLVRCT